MPELLDALPVSDPSAIRSRLDLQRVNRLMRHPRILAEELRDRISGACVVELGSGDGTLLLNVARQLGRQSRPVRAILVDRQPSVSSHTEAAFTALGWNIEVEAADVFDWLSRSRRNTADLAIANLFLHHFEDAAVAELFGHVATHTRRFICCEPLRSQAALTGAALLRFLGCNEVTLHDARVSVRAGFRGQELSRLWPTAREWRLSERRAGLFTHTFTAQYAA